jgi:formylglycine-generating enzyme required for sulfatase activity
MQSTEVTNDQMAAALQWAYDKGGRITVSSWSVRNVESDRELLDLDASECRITWNATTERFELKAAKGAGYPCVEVSWYGAAAYCNYRSEMEGLTPCYDLSDWSCDFGANGYRLPTEAEWAKAARGGLIGKRFPWGDMISHSQANYYSDVSYSYDVSPTRGLHPDWDEGGYPFTSPVGTFEPNGYGLYDMAGNVWEWCWDRHDYDYYATSPDTDPRGPASGTNRVFRGGGWGDYANICRAAYRDYYYPVVTGGNCGFRAVRSSVP